MFSNIIDYIIKHKFNQLINLILTKYKHLSKIDSDYKQNVNKTT